MPVIGVKRDLLFEKLEENYGAKPAEPSTIANEKFSDLCFEFGIELDDVTSEKEIQRKMIGKEQEGASDTIIYKIDVPANRYDLLCVEGLSRTLRIFLGKEKCPQYKLVQPKNLARIIVKKETEQIRPYVVCAILRGIKFNEDNYQSFIDLQEKLHQNVCRRRTLVSIGTHDLDTIEGPFTYEALPPDSIKFAPLNNTQEFTGSQLMKHLENDLHLRKYLDIIRSSPVYPVIYDAKRRVLSLPPIINGNHSKITLNTRNVFIEVTATDLTKAEIVLNTICAMFSEYSQDKFTIEPVEVVLADGKKQLQPNLEIRKVETDIPYINSCIGLNLAPEQIVNLLTRMSLTSQLSKDKSKVIVDVPITRSDILHPCDIMEDVAIAYGFNNIPRPVPNVSTEGGQRPINKLTDLLRHPIAMAGYTEVLTLILCSRDENYKFLRRDEDGLAVELANPASSEYQIARTSLLPGILKTIQNNLFHSLPMKIFEISDVVLLDSSTDVGARNERHFGALIAATMASFQDIHGLLDRIMTLLRVPWKNEHPNEETTYEIKPSDDPAFLQGRGADVFLNDKKIGSLGIIHPEVLQNYQIPITCSALEISIEPFV